MTQTQKDTLASLLSEKKLAEAGKMIKQTVAEPFDAKQKGAALAGVAAAYMDVTNKVNTQYRDALKEAIAGLQKVQRAERAAEDNAQISEVKKELGV